jgi:hypothetical protein
MIECPLVNGYSVNNQGQGQDQGHWESHWGGVVPRSLGKSLGWCITKVIGRVIEVVQYHHPTTTFTLCWRQIIDRCRAIVLRLCKCHNLYDIK